MRAVSGMASIFLAAGLFLIPAGTATAQPAQQGNGLATIGNLEAAGYDVVVDRVGHAPLERCTVTSVRNRQVRKRTFWVGEGEDRELVTVVVGRTITVSLDCDR